MLLPYKVSQFSRGSFRKVFSAERKADTRGLSRRRDGYNTHKAVTGPSVSPHLTSLPAASSLNTRDNGRQAIPTSSLTASRIMVMEENESTGLTVIIDAPSGVINVQFLCCPVEPLTTAGITASSGGRPMGVGHHYLRIVQNGRPIKASSSFGFTRITRSYPSSIISTSRSSVMTSSCIPG